MHAASLIGDGESTWREALQRCFSQCGFRVETACDGLECLSKVRSLKPEMLVVDWELPWGGAAAVVAFLHETHSEFDIPSFLIIGGTIRGMEPWTRRRVPFGL